MAAASICEVGVSFTAERLSLFAGGRRLLAEASLDIRPGEVHALLGRNGAGKSSLLRLLAGELVPESGRVLLNGRPLSAWTPRQQARMRAVLPQSESLRFGFTAGQVVALGRYASAGPIEREREIVREALALAGVAELADRKYPSLSGGERARVQLARVLGQVWEAPAEGPRYLLLDEPTASLDLAYQHACMDGIRRFAATGAGVLVVLHDPNLALRYADRVTVLLDGAVIGQGPAREVLARPLLERAYGIALDLFDADGMPYIAAHFSPASAPPAAPPSRSPGSG